MTELLIKEKGNNNQSWKIIRIHPSWFSFIRYCENLQYGEIEKLRIQNGLPMIAEEVKKKIKFVNTDE